ncbi:hypothetical protein C8Q77DRAFT_1183595 [Trametes polyzona]|nr:hypothetical protein C8Q77DRAFT_1183595 [Trametes polyzona]
MASRAVPHDLHWAVVPDVVDDTNQPMWTCTLCADRKAHRTRAKAQHEEGVLHQTLLQEAELLASKNTTEQDHRAFEHESRARRAAIEDATRQLLAALAHIPPPEAAPSASPQEPPGFNWGLALDDAGETSDPAASLTFESEVTRTVAQALLDKFAESDDEQEEREDADVEEEPIVEPMVSVDNGSQADVNVRKRALPQDDAQIRRHWFPWHDKITCTLDVLTHLPRSVFSQRQLDLFLWLLRINDVDDVPSVRHILRLNAALQRACGIDSIAYKGVLGHTYYVNALDQIIAQEMANPCVRPHLSFYPEDTGGAHLSEASQAARWLHEAPDDVLTPMVRVGSRDFYVHEPLMGDDGKVRMPMRWFTRFQRGKHVLFAKCWEMQACCTDTGNGWVIVKRDDYEIAAANLMKTFPELCTAAARYNLPHPTNILGVCDPKKPADGCSPWSYTDPKLGNPWREQSKGHRVVAFPIWMYCDDTSGNLSKKWNEHNSVLFTAAGLVREQLQKEYNIHFLTTSNIAPPLEMMDGVVEQLESAQKTGVWAWDCMLNEPVLVLPWVLALLGDNPMQSEFACHIGLQAKFFCRNCWCKGRDVAEEQGGDAGDDDSTQSVLSCNSEDARSTVSHDVPADTSSVASGGASDSVSNAGRRVSKVKARAKKALESMSDMVGRVTSFLKPGTPRNKNETAKQLRSYFTMASVPGAKTTIKKERTQSGIKDTFQLAHLETLFKSYKNKRGYTAKQVALSAAIEDLPEHTTNPVWRIRELDAHQDTPVEVLHVVLLGFIKYFWRDCHDPCRTSAGFPPRDSYRTSSGHPPVSFVSS